MPSSTENLLKDAETIMKFYHLLTGIVSWEFVSTLGHEWDTLTGKRHYVWTIWIYLLCRITCILSFVFALANLDVQQRSSCQVTSALHWALGYTNLALSSLLVLLRLVAIWEINIFICVLAVLLWLVTTALNFRHVFLLLSSWDDALYGCGTSLGTPIANISTLFAAALVVFLFIYVGLIRKPEVHSHGIYRVLLHQDIVWLGVIIMFGLPSLVVVVLQLECSCICGCTMQLANYGTILWDDDTSYSPLSDNAGDHPSRHKHMHNPVVSIAL
ncbi:hypothetical protein OF83DRAFT_459751 [Amylostereum chailletii]|nr:hypothetical protein OF83DRAFT_459751 [Amylostereum chailletii]